MKSLDLVPENPRFLIDTGSELNLLKLNVLKAGTVIYNDKLYGLTGISDGLVKTIGWTNVRFRGVTCKMNIVPNEFPIEHDGILGVEFLKDQGAVLSFSDEQIALGRDTREWVSFINHDTVQVPARTRKFCNIKVKNLGKTGGYVPGFQAGPGIYAGECLTINKDGFARILIINTTTEDVNLTIPPVTLEAFDRTIVPVRNIKGRNEGETKELRRKRIDAVIGHLNLEELNKEERGSIINLVVRFPYQFHLPGDKLSKTTGFEHRIPTINDIPINVRQYRHPPHLREEIQRQVDNLLENDIVEESDSPYNSPVWIVPKKPDSEGNKRWRLVIDFRALNEKTIASAYPLPNITEILDQLGQSKYFSTLDLAQGFHQVPIDPRDAPKTAFSTPFHHLQYKRMAMGLKGAPASFQFLMDKILSGLQGIELFVYMDDIVVYANSLKEHDEKMKRLFGRLKTAGLTLQPEKCLFLRKEVAYLGHIISEEGVKPDPKKTQAVSEFPRPKTRKNIKQFLGLVGYYRRFVPDFAKIAKPLSQLLKREIRFLWGDSQERAFQTLKNILCTEPLLQYPKFDEPFLVTSDASDFAIGSVLSQGIIGRDLPIAYTSRVLTDAELNYSTTEKELLAIIYAVKQFRPYLYGRKFTLITDHRALVWLDKLRDPTSRLARWRI